MARHRNGPCRRLCRGGCRQQRAAGDAARAVGPHDELCLDRERLTVGVDREDGGAVGVGALHALRRHAEAQVLQSKASLWTWIVAGASGLLLLGATGWLLFGRKKMKAAAVEDPEPAAPEAPPPPPEPNKVCPVCGEQYPPNAEFCGKDGAFLLRMN